LVLATSNIRALRHLSSPLLALWFLGYALFARPCEHHAAPSVLFHGIGSAARQAETTSFPSGSNRRNTAEDAVRYLHLKRGEFAPDQRANGKRRPRKRGDLDLRLVGTTAGPEWAVVGAR